MRRISLLKRNTIKRLFRYGLFSSLVFTVVVFLDSNQFFIEQVFLGFVFGILVGLLEDFTSHRKFVNVSLPLQFLVKIFGIILIVVVLMSLTMFLHNMRPLDMFKFIRQSEISSPMVLAFIVAFTVMTYFQIEKLIGKNMLINYLKGRYKKPKKEIRVFLFVDLKSSTTLSEKLGNDVYYSFLNDAIYEMSEAIVETRAEIYQYVGDEIVFTWPLEKGIRDNNCLLLFERILDKLETKRSYFQKHYGYQPRFKGALHAGIVLAAEIGHIKKDIVYSGDVLNATARMESMCHQYQADLLVSKSLFNLLDRKHEIIYEDLGAISLKGKDEKIELVKIHSADSSYTNERKEIEKVLQRQPRSSDN